MDLSEGEIKHSEAVDEVETKNTLSQREQTIYDMICKNKMLSVEEVMAELDISRATVFKDYGKIKRITGTTYIEKTGEWIL